MLMGIYASTVIVVTTAPMFLALQYLYILWGTAGPCTLS